MAVLRKICFILCVVFFSSFAEAKERNCVYGKQHYRATVRHIESGGIGYDNGYTTIEAFLATDPSEWTVTPFLDTRGHIFDNAQWAANVGAGLRTLRGNRAYGINSYYDYRNTGRFNANQIGAGVETLGELWDFRVNGYLPFGTKNSGYYDPAFGYFSGNYLFLSEKYQAAMKGADAEVGVHFKKYRAFDSYAAAGPYYFIGRHAPATWGGKIRIAGIFKEMLTVEISDSFDRTFHNRFQGQIGLTIPLGPRSRVKERGRSCRLASRLNDRMLQPVGRQEIIVIDDTRKNNYIAIDPETGLPYFFVFVNNTSSSNGTYESPYPTLLLAQGHSSPYDIIYVFPGNGTTTGMASGISLQASQKFWGSGVSHPLQTTVGAITIPALSSSSPTITNTNIATDGNAITLATNNAISGFTIASAFNDAIFGTDPQSLDVSSCLFENTTTYAILAAFSGDASISITNNQFLNNSNGISLTLSGTSTVVCSDNTFKDQTSTFERPIDITANNNILTANIENNLFNHNVTGSISVNLNDVVNADISIFNNTITNNGTGGRGADLGGSVVISSSGTVDHCSLAIRGNSFTDNTLNPGAFADALYFDTSGAITTLEVAVSENTLSDIGGGLIFGTPVDHFTLVATDNIISGCSNSGISAQSSGLTTTGNITIENNTITDIGGLQSGINVSQSFSTLNLAISNNEINRCEGSGILSFVAAGIDSLIVDVSGNTISNCQNLSSNAASGIDLEQYTNLEAVIANNTLTDNTGTAVLVGSVLTTPTVCLTLTGNDSSTGYFLSNPADGTFYLSPCNVNDVNVGTIDSGGGGDITHIQSCSDHTLCP